MSTFFSLGMMFTSLYLVFFYRRSRLVAGGWSVSAIGAAVIVYASRLPIFTIGPYETGTGIYVVGNLIASVGLFRESRRRRRELRANRAGASVLYSEEPHR